MLSFTAGCICSAAPQSGSNQDNLLFAGQILPESNGGLSGVPTMKSAPNAPFLAAVFGGKASATHTAAEAFRSNAEQLDSEANLKTALQNLSKNVQNLSSAAISLVQDQLSIATLGSCRCFLCRERALYLFAASRAAGSLYTANGTLHSGDQLLLTTGPLVSVMDDRHILNRLAAGGSLAECLGDLAETGRKLGSAETITAILLRVN